VAKSRPTRGYETLLEADLEDLSYEQIIVDHPEEFTPRALWYSRRTLGLSNRWPESPAEIDGKTQQHTERLVAWLAARAAAGNGVIAPFTNAEAAAALDFGEPEKAGRAAGNIQSRIDFACYELGLPPLGLTATVAYVAAWQDQGRSWAFPVVGMSNSARERVWTEGEFARIVRATRELPAKSRIAWETTVATDETRLKAWAAQFGSTEQGENRPIPTAVDAPDDDWVWDEQILALDLYLRHRESLPGQSSPEILELSVLLAKLSTLLRANWSSTDRSPDRVHMKVLNFRRLDLQYMAGEEASPDRASELEHAAWKEFAAMPEHLRDVATALRVSIESQKQLESPWVDDEDGQTATEGRVLTRLHRVRERDPNLAKRKKDKVFNETGKLACEGCGTDAVEKYGHIGAGVADAHHIRPLHTLTEATETALDDLALLCATCHRVVHASKPWLTVAQLQEAIKNREAQSRTP
jgi:predicted HNH restriction endonuclease